MPDSEANKRNALKLAAHAANKFTTAESQRRAAIRFASDSGASLREIAAATGVPHVTVKRIIDREPES